MKKLSVIVAITALAATLSSGAFATGGVEPPHTCGGHIDFVCNEPGGSTFCTLWMNFRCTLGIL